MVLQFETIVGSGGSFQIMCLSLRTNSIRVTTVVGIFLQFLHDFAIDGQHSLKVTNLTNLRWQCRLQPVLIRELRGTLLKRVEFLFSLLSLPLQSNLDYPDSAGLDKILGINHGGLDN